MFHRRAAFLQGHGIFIGQRLAIQLFWCLAAGEADWKLEDDCGVGPETVQMFDKAALGSFLKASAFSEDMIDLHRVRLPFGFDGLLARLCKKAAPTASHTVRTADVGNIIEAGVGRDGLAPVCTSPKVPAWS